MEIKGFAGVLHEPVKIVTKEKVWKKYFFMEPFQGENMICANTNQELKE